MTLREYKDLLATVASVCTIGQFLSGILVCQKFVRSRTVGDASVFPFVAGFLSCSLWLRYGYFLNDTSIMLVNTIGATLQLSYVITYSLYTNRKGTVARQLLSVILFLTLVLAYMEYESDEVTAQHHLGLICCCVTIVFFAAPLTMLAHVVRVKSTESLPFSLIVANFVVSALWLAYGGILNDPFIIVTNGLGCVLSSVQLLLFVIYPSSNGQARKTVI